MNTETKTSTNPRHDLPPDLIARATALRDDCNTAGVACAVILSVYSKPDYERTEVAAIVGEPKGDPMHPILRTVSAVSKSDIAGTMRALAKQAMCIGNPVEIMEIDEAAAEAAQALNS